MRVFLLGFIQYGNRYDMSNSLFSKIIHYSIKYIVQESYGKIIVNPPLIAIVMKPKGFVSEICV